MSADIQQQYLEELLKFKARKELSDGFLEKKALKKLLKELTLQLGFDESVWKQRKAVAKSNYVIFEMLDDETELGYNMTSTINHQLEKHILKAISLDPFNKEYLEKYVFQNRQRFRVDKAYQCRLLKLIDPAKTEYTNMQVELGLSVGDVSFEYFDEHMTSKYVDSLVFLRDAMLLEKSTSTQSDLDELSKAAGFDKKELKELNEEVQKMLEVVEKSADDTFLDWQDVHKAYLVVDRLVDLAPLNPDVLYSAIYFYGNTLWRACLNCLEIRSGNANKGTFFKTFLDNEKPKRETLNSAALAVFEQAEALAKRMSVLPDEVFEVDEEDKFNYKFVSMRSIRSKHRMHEQDLNPAYIESFLRGQKIAFLMRKAEIDFKQNNKKFALIIGASLYLVSALLSIFVFGSIAFLWTFAIIPAFAAMGIADLRQRWWKKRTLDL